MRQKKKDPICQIREQLEQEIERLQQSLETVNSNFDNVSDPDLVDSYIYELNALSFRYKYLLRQMRDLSH